MEMRTVKLIPIQPIGLPKAEERLQISWLANPESGKGV